MPLCVDERRQPSDLKLQAHHDQQIGLAQLQQETGLGLDKVRILIALGNGFNLDLVAANFLRQRRQVGGGCDDVELLGRRPIGQKQSRQ